MACSRPLWCHPRISSTTTGSRPLRTTALFHQKGGTGKTTLAIASALTLARDHRVLLMDLDPQGTASAWGERYADHHGIVVRGHGPSDLNAALEPVARHFDHCILDCPPNLSEGTLQTLSCAQHLVIPVRPALPDIWALERVAALIGDASANTPALTVRVVFNQYQGQELRPLIDAVAGLGLHVHPTPIAMNPAFADLFLGIAPGAAVLDPVSAVLAEVQRVDDESPLR